MKRLLCCFAFLIPSLACADLRPPKATGALLSTNSLVAGTTIYTSSGTIQSFYASSATISTKLTIPNGLAATDAAAFGQIHVMQLPIETCVSVASATTTSVYALTTTVATITPTSTASKIIVFVSGQMENDTLGGTMYATLERNGTNLGGTNGFMITRISATAANVDQQSASTIYMDSPASVSALTYAVYIKNDNGTSSVAWGVGNMTQCIILVEVQ